MDIIGLGTYAMDVMMNVDTLPQEDGFAVVTNNTYVPGGSGTNVIVQAARLGAKCGFMAKIGDDGLGNDIKKSLEDEQIDTKAILIKNNGISLHTDIVVDAQGKKFILLNLGDAFGEYSLKDLNKEYLLCGDVFYTDLLPESIARESLKQAKASGMKTAFNMQLNLNTMLGFGHTKESILSSLKYVDLFAPCREGLYQLCETKDNKKCLDYLRAYFKGTLLITLGSAGSIAFDENDNYYEQQIIEVDTVDTTGAGDAYMGGMLVYYLLKGIPLKEAMLYSTGCSAITCTKLGARNGPTENELYRFIEEKY